MCRGKLTMNGAAMTQGIVEGNNEVLSAPLDGERETLKLQAATASQESNGQSEEGLKKKERLKKKRSDRMDTAKSVAASFPMVQLIDEVVKTSIPSQPSGTLRILTGCFVAHRSKTTAGFSLFASRIQSKFAAAPLPQSLTWCTSGQSARGSK